MNTSVVVLYLVFILTLQHVSLKDHFYQASKDFIVDLYLKITNNK